MSHWRSTLHEIFPTQVRSLILDEVDFLVARVRDWKNEKNNGDAPKGSRYATMAYVHYAKT